MSSPIDGTTGLIAPLGASGSEGAPLAEPLLVDDTPAAPVLVDPEVERAAFAELLALLKATSDGDDGTVVIALSAEEFAEHTFTPGTEE